MRGDLALFRYLLLILFISLLLVPSYIFAIVKFGQILKNQSDEKVFKALELGKGSNQHFFEYIEFQPVFLFCPWTIENPTQGLYVTKTRIDFTLQRQFRLRLQVHHAGEPLFINFKTLTRFHEHFVSAITAIQRCHDFPDLEFLESELTVIKSLQTDPVINQYT